MHFFPLRNTEFHVFIDLQDSILFSHPFGQKPVKTLDKKGRCEGLPLKIMCGTVAALSLHS